MVAERQAQNIPVGTIRKVLVSMGHIFKYAARHKYISNDPFLDAERPSLNHNNVVNRHFNTALDEAKIERIRFHDLRHTYASLSIEQGESIKYIQSQLGHSSPTVTLNVYAHCMHSVNQEAACRLENTIFEADGHKMVTKG